ncbi:MAG: hypothetical protein AAF202_01990, partial [Pseudomonadota bacterium]
IVPYQVFGAVVIWPIYSLYLVVFGLPHNFLTWSVLLPKNNRSSFQWETIRTAAIICLIFCALIPFTRNQELGNWILSLIAYYSLWHAYRQHHGICKLFDSIQSKRTGDLSLFSDRKALNLFFGLAAFSGTLWVFTHQDVHYLLSPTDQHKLIYPHIPFPVFQIYVAATLAIGAYAFKRVVYDRIKRGQFVPWPQIGLISVAIATYVVPFLFLPLEALPITVAIGTIFHNVQYFGFVWAFEKSRSEEYQGRRELNALQKLVAGGKWVQLAGLALVYSFAVIGLFLSLPHNVGLAVIYFIGFAHYVIDGYMWRRNINLVLGPVMAKWTFSEAISHGRSQSERSLPAKPLAMPNLDL